MEIYIGLEGPFRMNFGNGWGTYRAVIIDSNQAHQFDGTRGWHAMMMIDPAADIARSLRKTILWGDTFRELNIHSLDSFIKVFLELKDKALPCKEVEHIFADVLRTISGNEIEEKPLNRRIVEIVALLRGLPEKRLAAGELARSTGISESRLAHVFKEETGITVRRYILWLRLMEAVKLIFSGVSYTEAAHETGFADSAHLSRTYKRMTGLTLSGVLSGSKSVRVISM
jgi:AraC-like DNA-binding protein